MSWDVFIQDLPEGIDSAEDIPDDFEPAPLGARETVLARLRELHPTFRPDDAGFGALECRGGSIEIDVGDDDPTSSVALFVRGDTEIVPVVAAIVRALGGRALDSESETGLFDETAATGSSATWSEDRDLAGSPPPAPRPSWWRRLFRR